MFCKACEAWVLIAGDSCSVRACYNVLTRPRTHQLLLHFHSNWASSSCWSDILPLLIYVITNTEYEGLVCVSSGRLLHCHLVCNILWRRGVLHYQIQLETHQTSIEWVWCQLSLLGATFWWDSILRFKIIFCHFEIDFRQEVLILEDVGLEGKVISVFSLLSSFSFDNAWRRPPSRPPSRLLNIITIIPMCSVWEIIENFQGCLKL